MQTKKTICWLLLILGIHVAAWSRSPEEAEFTAAALLGDEIGEWIAEMNPPIKSLGIFSVHSNYPLESDYSQIVEAEVLKGLRSNGLNKVTTCPQCRSLRINVEEERLIIKKGAPDFESLKEIGRTQPVEAFLVISIYRTSLSIVAHAVVYKNPSAEVISSERFRVPTLNFSDASVQAMFTVGGGMLLGGPATGDPPIAVNISLLEELGFGKGGLNIGGVIGGQTIFYLNPTILFRGRFGAGAIAWSINIGAGYAIASPAKAIIARGGYDIYIGSLAILGIEASYLLSVGSEKAPVDGYVGVHLGISLGR